MENRQNDIEDDSVEVAAILQRLAHIKFNHVQDSERSAAVRRAIQFFRIHSATELSTLIDLIDYNDGQIEVHADPSDPRD